MDANFDFTFGRGRANFFVDNREAVGQSVLTRLRQNTGEWFLDVTDGTPYSTQVLGVNTQKTRDRAIRDRILSTQGVTSIESYTSSVDGNRKFSIQAKINTVFGQTEVSFSL